MNRSQSIKARSKARLSKGCGSATKKRRTSTYSVSPCEPDNMAKELAVLRRLKIAPSRIASPKGAGMGVFTTSNKGFCKPNTAVIFKKNEVILQHVTGIPAFRLKQQKTKKYLEWLYYDKICMPLTDDSNVIWGFYHIAIVKKDGYGQNLEIGILPDDLVIYMNDSPTPNCKIHPVIKNGFPKSLDNGELVKFPHKQIPIEFKVVALKNLPPDTELLWRYLPEDWGKAKNKLSSVDFKNKHMLKTLTEQHYGKIKEVMGNAFSERLSVTITNSFSTIQKQRLKNECTKREKLKYKESEIKFLDNLNSKFSWNKTSVLVQAETDPNALSAFIKYSLNKSCDMKQTYNNIRGALNKYKIRNPYYQESNKEVSFCYRWLSYDIEHYCHEMNFLCSSDANMASSFEWIGYNVDKHKDNARSISTLRERIRLVLLSDKSTQHLRGKLNLHIKNPINDYKKEWSVEEIERFSGIHKSEQTVSEMVIDSYSHDPMESLSFNRSRRTVLESARKCDIESQKLIIKQQVAQKHSLWQIACYLRRANVNLFVNRHYVTSTLENLKQFLEANFKRSEQKELPGYISYTDHQLLQKLINKGKSNESLLNKEIHRRIRQSHNKKLLRLFIKIKSENIKNPSTIIRQLNCAGLKYRTKEGSLEDFTTENLGKLFKNEKAPSVDKFFKQKLTNKQLLNNIETKNMEFLQKDITEVLRRGFSAPQLIENYIKLIWQKSRMSKNLFCRYHGSALHKHHIPPPASSEQWTADHIAEIISDVQKYPAPLGYARKSQGKKNTVRITPSRDKKYKTVVCLRKNSQTCQ